MTTWATLGDRVRIERRDERHMDQATLAKRANVSVRTVQRLEMGQAISKANLVAIERALELPPGELSATGIKADKRARNSGRREITAGGDFMVTAKNDASAFSVLSPVSDDVVEQLCLLATAYDDMREAINGTRWTAVESLKRARSLDRAIADLAFKGWSVEVKDRMALHGEDREPIYFKTIEVKQNKESREPPNTRQELRSDGEQ